MRTCLLVLLGLALFAPGCKSNPNDVLLERDLRMQEDKIYQLQWMLEDAHAAREQALRENHDLRRKVEAGDTTPPARGPALPRLNREPDPPRRNEAPTFTPPTIELGGDAAAFELPTPNANAPLGTGQPTQLVINQQLTGGLDRDGTEGDDGVFVVLEPRDASGKLVRTAGTISVVLMDPSLPGTASRVARWDFSANDVPNHFQNATFGRGLHFELLWPAQPPQNSQLQLFVRFTTSDGQKLTTEAPIDIKLAAGDRQTRSGSPAQAGAPQSRVRPLEDSARDSRSRAPAAGGSSPRDPRQATRNDRPEWRPYR